MKPEPCNLALKLLDADEACGACGHLARTHRNHASYVDPDAKPTKPDEFDGWTPDMLRTAIAFERATIAELRLELHREREQRQALERGVVEIRHAACVALTWASTGSPDVVNTKRAVDELARRLHDELAATKNDEAYKATLIRERDEWKARAVKLVELRENLISQRDAAGKELRDVTDVIAAVLSVPIGSEPGSASTMVRTLIGELVGLRAERERGIHARSNDVQRRAAESAVLALAWARDPARTREEIESQIKNLEAIDSPSAGYAAKVLRWTIANPNRRTSADFDAARRAIDDGRELP